MTRRAPHKRQLRPDIVTDLLQFLAPFAPCHDIEMGAYRGQREGVRLIEVIVDPFLVDLVRTTILRERLHVTSRTFELPEVLVAVIQKQILIVDVVAREQQSYGSGE